MSDRTQRQRLALNKDLASERIVELRRRLDRAEVLVNHGAPDPDFISLAEAIHRLVETLRASQERSGNVMRQFHNQLIRHKQSRWLENFLTEEEEERA
jgi:hypothetical protein